MLKNPTPQQIAVSAALLFMAVVVITSMLAFYGTLPKMNPLVFIGWAVGIFVAAYLILEYFLRKYIYRKIKLIYKTIHSHKVSSQEKEKTINLSDNIIQDVEDEVKSWADEQKKELDKYKSWAEYRRKFLGDISHELKTPIFNIQGYIHTILDGAHEDPELSMSFLKKAAKNVDRLNTIIEDLDSIARMESGEMILEFQTFDIKKLAEEVFDDLQMKAQRRNIKLELKDGADVSFKVKADRETIRQVLNNLINNSIKYGKENGRTRVGFYDMDKYILIEVADNGIGINKNDLNHVFDRFYRADKSRSREMGGSGLGLSIVKHILETHKQTIHVRSTPGLGSTFGFTLEKV